MSLSLASVDEGLPVIEISLTPRRLILSRRRRSSSVSPEFDTARTTSPGTTIPRSPWIASAGCMKREGVPVDARVAAIFRQMIPDFPIPVTTTRPLQAWIAATAFSKWEPSAAMRSITSRIARASSSRTRRPVSAGTAPSTSSKRLSFTRPLSPLRQLRNRRFHVRRARLPRGAGDAVSRVGPASRGRHRTARGPVGVGGLDEVHEERPRVQRLRLELGMELAGEKPRMILDLDHLDELSIRRRAGDPEPVRRELREILLVHLVAVPVPLADLPRAVRLEGEGVRREEALVLAEAH